jgi:hypothetical protein
VSELEQKKRELLNAMLEAAQREIVSKDPRQAMKGRYTRDCAVPIMHWLMDEYERVHGSRFLTGGGPKSIEDATAEVDILMMLMEGIGATTGNFAATQFQDHPHAMAGGHAMASLFVRSFLGAMSDRRPA